MRSRNLAISLIAAFVVSSQLQAASFDCMSANTLVEHAICTSPELGALDTFLAISYKTALAESKSAGQVQTEQRRWVTERDQCRTMSCLLKSYQNRIWQINPAVNRGEKWILGVFETKESQLNIIQTAPNELSFLLMASNAAGHTGEAEGKAPIYDGTAKFVDRADDCNLVMHPKASSVTVSQVGTCGFGMNVIADGVYQLVPAKSPVVHQRFLGR